MNLVVNNWASIKWALVLGVLAIGTLGCQNTPTLDPFMTRAVVPPPSTGSFAPPPAGTTTPYYNPTPPVTPSPGPVDSSGMTGPRSPILTAGAFGDAALVGVQHTAVEASVMVGPGSPAKVSGIPVPSVSPLTPPETPLRIVENQTPSATTAAIRPVGSAQSFGPGEPARFQPAGTVVLLDTKRADVSPSAGVNPSAAGSASGSLNWKPTR